MQVLIKFVRLPAQSATDSVPRVYLDMAVVVVVVLSQIS